MNGDQPVFIDATNEIRALRGARIAEEFDLDAVVVGSGNEFRRVNEIAATGLPIIVPLSYPKKPEATRRNGNPLDASRIHLEDTQSHSNPPKTHLS